MSAGSCTLSDLAPTALPIAAQPDRAHRRSCEGDHDANPGRSVKGFGKSQTGYHCKLGLSRFRQALGMR